MEGRWEIKSGGGNGDIASAHWARWKSKAGNLWCMEIWASRTITMRQLCWRTRWRGRKMIKYDDNHQITRSRRRPSNVGENMQISAYKKGYRSNVKFSLLSPDSRFWLNLGLWIVYLFSMLSFSLPLMWRYFANVTRCCAWQTHIGNEHQLFIWSVCGLSVVTSLHHALCSVGPIF